MVEKLFIYQIHCPIGTKMNTVDGGLQHILKIGSESKVPFGRNRVHSHTQYTQAVIIINFPENGLWGDANVNILRTYMHTHLIIVQIVKADSSMMNLKRYQYIPKLL